MGVFSRFKDIVNANINSLLDSAEDPDKMIRMMIREMEDTIVELKTSCAEKMAVRSRFTKDLDNEEESSSRWEKRARLAVEKGRDDLAKEALLAKKTAQERIDAIKEDSERLDTIISETKEQIFQLEEKLESTRQKHTMLIQRARHANEVKGSNSTLRKSGSEAMVKFAELENKIQRMEANAELSSIHNGSAVDSQFRKIERDEEAEAELNALKEQMKSEEE